jgi:O-succinylbenzoate synthase
MKIAEHHGLPVVVSSALESAVGISYGLALAASLPELNFACGLATGALLSDDLGHIPVANGEMSVTPITPNLDQYLVSPERHQWWEDRVMKTWSAIA